MHVSMVHAQSDRIIRCIQHPEVETAVYYLILPVTLSLVQAMAAATVGVWWLDRMQPMTSFRVSISCTIEARQKEHYGMTLYSR